MIGDRARDARNELHAVWMGNASVLVDRMACLADYLDETADALHSTDRSAATIHGGCAGLIRDVLTTEYDPTTGRRTVLPESLAP